MRRLLPYICAFLLAGLAALSLGAVGSYPARFEELIIGGGSGDTADGGADFEKTGDIVTTGDITANSIDATITGDVPAAQITGSITDAQISNTLTASKLVMASGSTSDSVDIGEINATGTPGGSTFLRGDGAWASVAGTGDVVGPASAVDNTIARYDSTTGKLLQGSGVAIEDDNDIVIDENDAYIYFRNAADSADHAVLGYTSADNTLLSSPGADVYIRRQGTDVTRTSATGFMVLSPWDFIIQEGSYTTTFSVDTLSANRSITVPNATGVMSLLGPDIGVSEISATGTPSATTYLRGDGAWATPAGSGTVVGPGSSTNNAFPLWNGTGGDTLADSAWTTSNVPRLDNADTITADWDNTANPWDLATETTGTLPRENTEERTIYWFSGGAGLPMTDPGADMAPAITADGTIYTPFDKNDELVFTVPIPSTFDGSVETIKLYWEIPTATEAITWSISCTVLGDSDPDNTSEATPTAFTAATPDAADDLDIISVSDSDILGADTNAGKLARCIIKATDADGFSNEPRFIGVVMEY